MKLHSKKTLWEGAYLRTVEITYTDVSGINRTWEAVERKGCEGIIIVVPVTRDGHLLLIRQYRPAINKHVIEFPAGLVDKGEDTEAACSRELIEETGYMSSNIYLMFEGAMSTGINSELWHAFLALDAEEATEELKRTYPPDENEDITVIKVPLDSLEDFFLEQEGKGETVDLRIPGLLVLAKKHMKQKEHQWNF
ncbi:NUDIX hydrolase [Nitrospirota bacterium]